VGEITRYPSLKSHKMNHFKKIENAFILFALLFAFPVLATAGQYKVVRVVDGDTIVIRYNAK